MFQWVNLWNVCHFDSFRLLKSFAYKFHLTIMQRKVGPYCVYHYLWAKNMYFMFYDFLIAFMFYILIFIILATSFAFISLLILLQCFILFGFDLMVNYDFNFLPYIYIYILEPKALLGQVFWNLLFGYGYERGVILLMGILVQCVWLIFLKTCLMKHVE